MASLLEIKKKISGVTNTRKITKAMQLVAASKMQQFQRKALSSRGYVGDLLDVLQKNVGENESIYSEKRTEGPLLFVIYTSDKGLCGALNTKLINSLFRSNIWNETPAEQRLLITIGRKSTEFAKNNGIKVEKNFSGVPEKLTNFEAITIVDQILEYWRAEKCREIIFVSPHYKNSFTNYPVRKTFLPFSDEMLAAHLGPHVDEDEAEASEPMAKSKNGFMLYSPDQEQVTERLHELIVHALFSQSFLELKAAEYSSRMLAMKNATDAADNMIDDLTLTFNKARQQSITQEIAELAGASAAFE